MPLLSLPDGAQLHWEQTGDGPSVLVLGFNYSEPSTLAGIVEELAPDHRVLTYHLRGTGASSASGPYDAATDQRDLEALLEHAGGARLAVALGDGGVRAIRVAAARPDLLDTVVCSGSPGIPAPAERSENAMASSPEVLRALARLLETDYRAAVRTIVGGGGANPQMDESAVRERVDRITAHCSHESVMARMNEWIRDDPTELAQQVDGRLWILHYSGNPWFPEELVTGLRAVLPEAHFEPVDEGGLSRPDLTAAVVRGILG